MGTGHNFFHQRNNWRAHYFDLSLFSTRYWRVSHALSHHLFPNTLLDLGMFRVFKWQRLGSLARLTIIEGAYRRSIC